MYSTGFLAKLRGRSFWIKCWSLLFVLVPLIPAQAQQPPVACKLLQPAELESALGGKAGKFADYGSPEFE